MERSDNSFGVTAGDFNGDDSTLFNSSYGWVSTTGEVCEPCVAGKAPTEAHIVCDVCPPGQYSSFGLSCGYCEIGKEPNVTLMLIVLLKIDLTKEDIPGAEDTVGAALLFANTIPTGNRSVACPLACHGLDTRDAIKTWKGDEDKGGKKGKKGKKEVGRTEHTLPCWL